MGNMCMMVIKSGVEAGWNYRNSPALSLRMTPVEAVLNVSRAQIHHRERATPLTVELVRASNNREQVYDGDQVWS